MARTPFDDGHGPTYNPNDPWGYNSGREPGNEFWLGNQSQYGGGKVMVNTPSSGAHTAPGGDPQFSDADRFRKMGQEMAGREAYQFDWGMADAFHNAGNNARNSQSLANELYRRQATGQDKTSYNFGAGLVQKGLDAQTAGALSARGGPLSQASALNTANSGAAAQQAQGMNQVRAQQAADMAYGRSAFAQGAADIRAADAKAQGLSDQQSELQTKAELDQRDLNQKGQIWGEGNAFNVNKMAADSAAGNKALDLAEKQAREDAAQAAEDRKLGMAMKGAETGVKLFTGSDSRMKNKATLPMTSALLALKRQGQKAVGNAHGQADALKYGASLSDLDQRDADVNAIKGGVEYKRDMYGREGDKENDDFHKKLAQLARNDNAFSDPYATRPSDGKLQDDGALRAYASGPQKAKEGYAASRAGKPGSIDDPNLGNTPYSLGGGYSDDWAAGDKYEKDRGLAPGSKDFLKYGKGDAALEAARDKRMDPKSKAFMTSGMIAKRPAPLVASALPASGPEADVAPESMISDPAAKREAFLAGADFALNKEEARAKGQSSKVSLPDYVKNTPPAPKTNTPVPAPAKKPGEFARAASPGDKVQVRQVRERPPAESIPARPFTEGAGPAPFAPPTPPAPALPEGYFDKGEASIPSDPDAKTTRGEHGALAALQQDANRRLAGETYTYKPGFGEDTKQLHHGFMADNFEGNPITETALRYGEGGLRKVDMSDLARVTASGVAENQEQIDKLEAELARLKGGRR